MGEEKKYLVIVNPAAGRGAGARCAPQLERALREEGIAYSLRYSERPWHASELALQGAREGFPVVVAVGGDGTSNEVLNGLVAAGPAPEQIPALGVVSVGRGNDFAFALSVPKGIPEACRILARDKRRRIDVGRVIGGDYPQGRYFGNGVGIGFDAVVGFEAAKFRRLSGFPSYLAAAFKTMFLYSRAPLVEIRDGERSDTRRALQISVMNGRRMGGAFFMAPRARPDDGIFDLCLAEEVPQARMPGLFLRFIKGNQAESPYVTMGQSRRLSIRAIEGGLAVHADGETICTAGETLEIECFPARLEALTAEAEPEPG